MPTTDLGSADEIAVNETETGFELWFSTEHGNYSVNIQTVAPTLYRQVREQIGAWISEGQAAVNARPVTHDDHAYAPDDPKRSDWHSVHADLYPRDES